MTSRARIDKLGERLKAGPTTEADLRLLDEYRLTFAGAYQSVIDQISAMRLRPTGRPAKSTKAIIDKLQRESIRLSQIQDIAGCRVVVEKIVDQDRVVAELIRVMPASKVLDRRARPSHGYRAVHVVVDVAGQPVEIQVRTRPQHFWAELSEQVADRVDPALKYGGGPIETRRGLEAALAVTKAADREGGTWTVEEGSIPILAAIFAPTEKRPRDKE